MLHHIENHVENMRKKPDHIKKQYALGVSLVVTIVIFTFWVSAQKLSLNPEAETLAKKTSPVKALTANAVGAWDYIHDTFFGANKTQYSSDNIEVVGKN